MAKADRPGVWVFNGRATRNPFPSGVFTEIAIAESWIERNQLSGTLTWYPLDISAYDWATSTGAFKPRKEHQTSPEFIGTFSDASQEHYH